MNLKSMMELLKDLRAEITMDDVFLRFHEKRGKYAEQKASSALVGMLISYETFS